MSARSLLKNLGMVIAWLESVSIASWFASWDVFGLEERSFMYCNSHQRATATNEGEKFFN